jgi:peptide/nickel transport system permease protein
MKFLFYYKHYRKVVMAGILIAGCVGAAFFAPLLAPYDPLEFHSGQELRGPSRDFRLGTDEFGRDILSRLIYGIRISLGVSFVSVSIALALGLIIGLVSGYKGGWIEDATMRAMDAILAFPPILLTISIVAFFGPGLKNTIIAISIVYLPRFVRVFRSSVLSVKELQYIQAAKAAGASAPRIIVRHILPNIRAPMLVQTSLSLSTAILFEAALSYLGLGTQPPTASWGRMLSEARSYLVLSPWGSIFPGIAIVILILGFNLLGDSLRDLFDPKLRI